MPLLLNIDTATEHASVCISNNEHILGLIESTEQKNHASFVQPAIEELLSRQGYTLSQVDAVAATAGPGSYTGLRVGLASAKGICYALQKPLILVNTLEIMAQAVLSYYEKTGEKIPSNAILYPMIDARRMEVFTAIYTSSLEQLKEPYALIIDQHSFDEALSEQPIIFSGSGHEKVKSLISHPSAIFCGVQHNASHLAAKAVKAYLSGHFADLAYSEPLYVKEFFNPSSKG